MAMLRDTGRNSTLTVHRSYCRKCGIRLCALRLQSVEGRFGAEAALLLDPPGGRTIDACVAVLEQVALGTDHRLQLFGRIRQVVRHQGLPDPPSPGADRIAELYARELESRPRWFAAEALAHAGAPGRQALVALLLRFPDDDSDQAKQIIAALKTSLRGDLPPELESSPGSGAGYPTHRADRWRAWAEKLSP